ncbi:DUF3822 family protein [Bacteroides sp. 224]|uniref:DUF3822 family protein n=1 Tax=Bacteroides sp. 224 TaxID=2302936 RepID=UPI0013CFD11A|nr:DUF3822 family protein [Bacteroides sp. 224]NDV66436.1 DUF3822 family protein [Bacteroides sp. 224]
MPERATLETLSIRLSADGFSFSIYNPISDNSIHYFDYKVDQALSLAANLKQAFKELDFLSRAYKRVNVIVVSKRFTLIPLELFDDEMAETLFYYNHPVWDNEKVLYNILRKYGTVILFAFDKSVYTSIGEHYPDTKFYSQSSSLIEYFSMKSRSGNTKKMYVYVHQNFIDVYCFERGQLLLVNSFTCKQTEDRIYYLLYVWKQLNMDQLRDELNLTGELPDKEQLIKGLQRFVQQVFVINPSADLAQSAAFNIEKVPFDMQILLSND